MEESLEYILESIQTHRTGEINKGTTNVAIARAACHQSSKNGTTGEYVYWLLNRPLSPGMSPRDGNNVTLYKNSLVGGLLTMYRDGVRTANQMKPGSHTIVENTITLNIHNHSTFKVTHSSVEELVIKIGMDKPRMFQDLGELYNQMLSKQQLYQEKLKKQRELEAEAKRKAEDNERLKKLQEQAAKEAEEKRLREQRAASEVQRKVDAILQAQEEARRKEEERINKERQDAIQREMDENLKAIAQYEQAAKEANDIFEEARSFVRKGDQLRSQHLLDPTQETAKRSHAYDGVPIVIDGGPGTGKTTTLIQRLMYLISFEALEENEILTPKQREVFADPKTRNSAWLFFSPTQLLLNFLKNNMTEEGLSATENNTTTLEDFREKMMREYMLTNPQTDGPFMLYHPVGKMEETLIVNPREIIPAFESYCVHNLGSILAAAAKLNTAEFGWHSLAVEIKSYCAKASEIKDMMSMMDLFNTIQYNEKKKIEGIESDLRIELKIQANHALNEIKDKEPMKAALVQLFDKWRRQVKVVDEKEADASEMDEDIEEEEPIMAQRLDFEPKLFAELKKLLKPLALRRYNSKQTLSARQKELYDIVKPVVDQLELKKLSDLLWFDKNFGFLCKGIESNILNQIPRLYKLFRKKMYDVSAIGYNRNLLEKLINKTKGNKRLHPDEQDLIIGFINNLLSQIYQRSRARFEEMKNQSYVNAYRQHAKHVIGVDEATDYTLLDYYFIASFRHYEFSSVTLCGDIMQGLNANGVQAWSDLNGILPGLEVLQLSTSYRQLPSLVEVSKKMYFDDQGVEAPYHSNGELRDTDPKPLAFVSENEEEKAEWMANRILEIYQYCNNSMPSVGIFIPDDRNVQEFADLINSLDMLNGIKVVAGRDSSATKMVRVFHLTEVKGMEFEAAFFHDIDKAAGAGFGNMNKIMRRHLYVGISRAATFLGATFCQEEGNEDTLAYFNQEEYGWMM